MKADEAHNVTVAAQKISKEYEERIDAPPPIICSAKCSSSAIKDIFGTFCAYKVDHSLTFFYDFYTI